MIGFPYLKLRKLKNIASIGINIANPNRPLHTQAVSGSSQIATFANNDFVSGTTGTSLQIATGATTGNTDVRVQVWNTGETVQGNLTLQWSGGNVGIGDTAPGEKLDVNGNINATGVIKIDDTQVVGNRVVDARCDDTVNSGDATTDGVIDALRDAMITHGLIAAT